MNQIKGEALFMVWFLLDCLRGLFSEDEEINEKSDDFADNSDDINDDCDNDFRSQSIIIIITIII
jgi:hypothetical protein